MINQRKEYSLLRHNTFGVDVNAARFFEYDTVDDLRKLITKGLVSVPYLHIGQGSNLLFTKDYRGTILHSLIKGIDLVEEAHDYVLLKVGAGVVWDDFVEYCVANGWYGAENLSDIPGEVGASAVQNIGAYGVEAKDLIISVCTVNLEGHDYVYKADDCQFAYRHSIFKEPHMRDVFVTHVYFRLSKEESYTLDYGTVREELKNFPAISLKTVREAIQRIRASKLPDPRVLGNAGSFFMNPVVNRDVFEKIQTGYPRMPFYEISADAVKIPAGWLIEQSGWKGKALGPAAVHDKQALVLVNKGGATGSDIIALSDAVRAAVKEKFGIEIKPEVKFV